MAGAALYFSMALEQGESGLLVIEGYCSPRVGVMAIYTSPCFHIFVDISSMRIAVAILAVLESKFEWNCLPSRHAYGLFVAGDAWDSQVSAFQDKTRFLVLSDGECGWYKTFHSVAFGAISAAAPLSKLSLMEIIVAVQTTSVSQSFKRFSRQMAFFALYKFMLSLEREICPVVIEIFLIYPAPSSGIMAGGTYFSKLVIVWITMAVNALRELSFLKFQV